MQNPKLNSFKLTTVALALLACLSGALTGCEVAGWVANSVAGPTKLDIRAEYKGLEGKRTAVLVDADMSILYQHQMAQVEVCQLLSQRIAGNIPTAKVIDAKDVLDFQQRNIYWNTVPYSDLIKRLNVDRLVIVDLVDYRLHEPGNVHVWKGTMSVNVAVIEADALSPNDAVYSTTVSTSYPPDQPLGVVNSDQQTIRLGTLDLLTRAVAGKFYDRLELEEESE